MSRGRLLFRGGNTPTLNAIFREQGVPANRSCAVLWRPASGICPCLGTMLVSDNHLRFYKVYSLAFLSHRWLHIGVPLKIGQLIHLNYLFFGLWALGSG
jgi:hypothetical protein